MLATQISPTAVALTTGQPWLFHSSRTCVVTFTGIEYASRPNQAIDGRGLSPHKTRSLVGCSTVTASLVTACCGLILWSAVPAQASQTPNGLPFNGMPYNGTPIQGLPFNGLPTQGVISNGVVTAPPAPAVPQDSLPWNGLSQRPLGAR